MNRQEEALVRAAKIITLALASLSGALGILLVISSVESFMIPLRLLLGLVAVLLGAGKIFGYFTNDLYRIAFQFDLATGLLVTIFGTALLALPAMVMPYLALAVMVYVLLDGLLRLQMAIDAYRFGMHHWYLLLVLALILALGALAMFLFAKDAHRLIWMGAMMVADAGVGIFVTVYTVRDRPSRG